MPMRWFSLCLFLLHARPGIDLRKAEMHFIVQPPSRSLQARITYEFTPQDSILIWDFGRGLELISWQASFPVQSIQRDTLRQTLTFVAATALSGGRHILTVQYVGEPRSTGFGSFEVKEHATGYVLWTLSHHTLRPDLRGAPPQSVFCAKRPGEPLFHPLGAILLS
jgi:hypothetical protein